MVSYYVLSQLSAPAVTEACNALVDIYQFWRDRDEDGDLAAPAPHVIASAPAVRAVEHRGFQFDTDD
jgi:hypothetical protein